MERMLHTKYLDQKELLSRVKAGVNLSRFKTAYANHRVKEVQQEIDFRQLLDKIIRNQKVINKNHCVEINVNIRNEAAFISNKLYVELVLKNLISGTIRSQSTGTLMPYVYIKIHSHERGINILIRDNTLRVKKEAFETSDMHYGRFHENEEFGFELFVVKQTIKKLHGLIEIEFVLEEGTEYKIHLPNLCQ